MIHKMLEKIESLEYFRNWNSYNENLEGYKKVKLYYGELIKEWVCGKKYPEFVPIEIPIIFDLLYKGLQNYEKSLNNFELKIGKDALNKYIKELKGQREPSQIIQKIRSLDYESDVFVELNKKFKNIKKRSSNGDWETVDKIISVKSILDLDLNYQFIENLLKSFFYIKEYSIIRKYKSIRLENEKKFRYEFREIILKYLRENIIEVLEKFDKVDSNSHLLEGTCNDYEKNLRISIQSYIDNSKKTIAIFFILENKETSKITIKFVNDGSDKNNNLFDFFYDTYAYFYDENNFNEEYFLKSFKEKIDKFNNEFSKIDINKTFEGWIVFSRHPKDEEYFLKNEKEFIDKIKKIKNNIDYKIFLYIIPQWRFNGEKNLIYEI